MFDVLNGAMVLSKVEQLSKNREDVQELLEAYQQTRIKLLEAAHWYEQIHRQLMVRTDEGKAAIREYQEKMEQLQKEAEAKKDAEPVAEGEQPKLTLLPQVANEVPNG
jgi:hypothetical protein